MKQVKFDKCCMNICCYLKPDKWYDIDHEESLTIYVKDDSGTSAPYAKVWVAEERTVEDRQG